MGFIIRILQCSYTIIPGFAHAQHQISEVQIVLEFATVLQHDQARDASIFGLCSLKNNRAWTAWYSFVATAVQ